MQECGYQLVLYRVITHSLMPAIACSCVPARVADFVAAFESAHTRRIESNSQQDTCPYKRRVDMSMSPIVVPYQGTNTMCPPSGTTAYWAYEACVHAHGIRKYDLGYRHTICTKSSLRNAVVSGLPYLPI